MWFVVDPRTYTKNTCVKKRDWITCSKYDSHWIAPINGGGGRGDLNDHILNTIVIIPINEGGQIVLVGN
jgi:hypothetical protein